jgi:hypothetical protein
MLQVFHMDVAKVDQVVTYVVMVVHVCKLLFPMFHLFSRRMSQVCLFDVAYVSHIYCKCSSRCCVYFCNGFKCFFWCFCKCFRCMFQLFQMPSDVYCKCCI